MAEQQQPQQPQGTEYTLQGVMRFLQVEWHNHERSRNAWDIERAELKAKIAKQEGDFRNSRRLNVSLDKQVRMLENVVKTIRTKTKSQSSDQLPHAQDESLHLPNGHLPVGDEAHDKQQPASMSSNSA